MDVEGIELLDEALLKTLEALSDEQLRVLDAVVAEMGLERGFGSYWWE